MSETVKTPVHGLEYSRKIMFKLANDKWVHLSSLIQKESETQQEIGDVELLGMSVNKKLYLGKFFFHLKFSRKESQES